MFSLQNQEYLFQLILIFRKTIPSNLLFYYVFFLLKFTGVYLLTHNMNYLEANTFTLETILRRITLLSANLSLITGRYELISFLIFCILLLLLIAFCVLLCRFFKISAKAKQVIQSKNYSKHSAANKIDCFALKLFIAIYLVVVLLSQHIIELLLFCAVPLLTSKIATSKTNSNKEVLQLFISQLYLNHYVLFSINMLSILIMMCFLYLFIFLASSMTLTTKKGFNLNISHFEMMLMVVIFQAQGFHSISNYILQDQPITLKFILCSVSVGLLILLALANIRQYNHSKNILWVFINLLICICLFSGITEVILYFTISTRLMQIDSLVKGLLILLNSFFVNIAIVYAKKRFHMNRFFKYLFSESNKQTYQSIEAFCDLMANHILNKNDFIGIIHFLQTHLVQCKREHCQCRQQYKALTTGDKKTMENQLMKILASIAENEIISLIHRSKDRDIRRNQIKQLYYLHVDFILTVKKNHFLALYLSRWYQESKANYLGFFTKYLFYEMQEDIVADSTKKTGAFSGRITITSRNPRQSGYSRNSKQIKLLQLQEFSNNMLHSLSECLVELEKFISFKAIARTGMKSMYSCESLLDSIITYMKKYDTMMSILESFFAENAFIPVYSIELSYILQNYFLLFKGGVPEKYRGKITQLPRYEDYLYYNANSDKYLMASLSNDEKTIIDYISIRLVDELGYTNEEIKGSDLHEKLLPSYLASYHFIFVKAFILEENMKIKKSCYVLDKKRHIVPYNLTSRALPSFARKLCLITKLMNASCKDMLSSDKKKMMMYYLCLDSSFNFLATCFNFTQHFIFPIAMLHTLRLNLCSFFGLKEDDITKYFNAAKKRTKSSKGKEIRNSILDTIPRSKEYDYDNVLNHFTIDKEPIEGYFSVSKNKLINSLKYIEKNIEELGLEQIWKDNIARLFSRIAQSGGHEKHITTFSTMLLNAGQTSDFSFTFFFKLKHIGNMYYYTVILADKSNETPLTTIRGNDGEYDYDHRKSQSITSLLCSKPLSGNETCAKSLFYHSKDNSCNDLLSLKNLNQSSNSSKQILLPNTITTTPPLPPKNQFDLDFNASNKALDPGVIQAKLKKTNREVTIIRMLQWLCFICLVAVNIINFAVSSSFISLAQMLFHINTYSFLLSSEVLFASLASIRACLIQEEHQSGSLSFFQEEVFDHSTQMLSHLQEIQKAVSQIGDISKVEGIYSVLLEAVEYEILLPNWSLAVRNSSLLEELYFLHFYLSNFDLTTSESCKLDHFVKNRVMEASLEVKSTNEERVVYYIIKNVLSKISISLYELTEVTNALLNDYNDKANMNMTLCNISLLIIAFMSFLLEIIYTFRLKYSFGNMVKRFFYQDTREGEFTQDIKRLKSLINNFGEQGCNSFEGSPVSSQTLTPTNIIPCHQHVAKKEHSLAAHQQQRNTQDNDKKSTQKSQKRKPNNKATDIKRDKTTIIEDKPLKIKNQIQTDMNGSFTAEVEKLTKLKFMLSFFILMFFLFISFILIQVGSLFFSNSSSIDIKEANLITIYYLLRLPKFAELILYSEITVITNDYYTITPKSMNFAIENIYNISSWTGDSLLNSLENKYYIELHNQLALIRATLERLFSDSSKFHMFPRTQRIDRSIQGKDFCASIGKEFLVAQQNGRIDNWVDFFSEANKESKQCRMIGDEINLDGMKIVFDFLIQNLNVLYVEFEGNASNGLSPQKEFLKHDVLELIADEIQTTFSSLNFVFAHNIIKDMQTNYICKYNVETVFSIVSLVFSCGSIILLAIMIIRTFERNNNVLDKFWSKYDKALKLKKANINMS